MKQADQLKIGLKAYRYLSEGIELATEVGYQVDEAELVKLIQQVLQSTIQQILQT